MRTQSIFPALARAVLCAVVVSGGCRSLRHAAPPDDGTLSQACAHYGAAMLLDYELGTSSDVSQAHLDQAIAADPNRARLRSRMAVGLLNHDNDAALAQLRDSCVRNPTSVECLLDLAEACRFTGRLDDAVAAYERAIAIAPDSFAIYHNLAQLHASRDDIEALLRTLERANRKITPPVFVHLLAQAFGRRFTESGELLYAARLFDFIATASDEGSVRRKAYHTAGQIYGALGNRKAAEQRLRQAIAIGPPLPYSFLRLADLYLQDDPDRALRYLLEGTDALPDDALLRASLGQIYSLRGDNAAAIRHFELVYQQLRGSEDAKPTESFYLLYAGVLERAKQIDRVEAVLAECIEKYPDSHQALNFLAYLWAEAGTNLDKALTYVERALAAEPANAAYIDTRGWICFKQGRLDAALADILRASELMGDDPVLADHLGDIYSRLGRRDEAVAAWQRSHQLNPDDPNVIRKLREAGAPLRPDPAVPPDSARTAAPAPIAP